MQEHKTLHIRSRVFQGLVKRHLSKEQFKAIMTDLDAIMDDNETDNKPEESLQTTPVVESGIHPDMVNMTRSEFRDLPGPTRKELLKVLAGAGHSPKSQKYFKQLSDYLRGVRSLKPKMVI